VLVHPAAVLVARAGRIAVVGVAGHIVVAQGDIAVVARIAAALGRRGKSGFLQPSSWRRGKATG
jgi:hypothetical protein